MRNIFLTLLIGIFFTGCSSVSYRSSSTFDTFFDAPKKVVIFPLDIKVFQLTAGGLDKYKGDWSKQAKDSMVMSLENAWPGFSNMEFDFINASQISQEEQKFIDGQKSFFYVSAYSIVKHTYEPGTKMKHKIENFDYTMGQEFSTMKQWTDADAILFLQGRNYIWSKGRTSLAVFSGLVGVATGVYMPIPAGDEWVVASLVDIETGEILWFNYIPKPGDMRKESVDKKIIKKLFKKFPQK